jgi:AcrR family transcriptional regulator
MKSQILERAISVLRRRGLHLWSTAVVAREAGCAKGLVHYHYRTKSELLARVADTLKAKRLKARLEALAPGGASALDQLWNAVREEVRSRDFEAWAALLAWPDSRVRQALRPTEDEFSSLGRAAALALELQPSSPEELGRVVDAGLSGFQIGLLRNDVADAVREAYDRFWLGLIG